MRHGCSPDGQRRLSRYPAARRGAAASSWQLQLRLLSDSDHVCVAQAIRGGEIAPRRSVSDGDPAKRFTSGDHVVWHKPRLLARAVHGPLRQTSPPRTTPMYA